MTKLSKKEKRPPGYVYKEPPLLIRPGYGVGAGGSAGAAEAAGKASAYDLERADLLAQFKGETDRRNQTYARETDTVREDTAQDIRAAYVAARSSAKRAPQVLRASGLTGGAVKSALGDAGRGYGQLRAELAAERDRRLTVLQEEFLQGGAADRESYQLKLNALNKRYKKALERLE